MKSLKKNTMFPLLAMALCALSSCSRSSNDVWEDTKSAGRHVKRGVYALSGYPQESRQIRCKDEFCPIEDMQGDPNMVYQYEGYQGQETPYGYQPEPDFVPLEDQVNSNAGMAPPPRETPGEPGSSVPGIEYFRDPNTMPQMAGIFRTIYFDYDSSLIKGQANMQTIRAIANFMQRNPNVYVFIEGHTCERGPQAYNLALGTRRSNMVRNRLVEEGANPNNLFTISFGKERPCMIETHEEALARNRRVEFKVYVR